MSTYSIKDELSTAAYALAVLEGIAHGDFRGTEETAEEYAQRHLGLMVAEGSIEVES